MDNFFNSKNLIDVMVKWKYQLATVAVAAVLLSAFFSSPIFITPLYKSNAVLYPSNIAPYSDENETEQSVQIFQSRDIRDSLVKKFDLARHYGIDSAYEYFESALVWEYSQRIKVNKTPYEAVEVEVWDQDPIMARDIINAMMEFYNTKIRKMHKEKFAEVVVNYQFIIDLKKRELDSLAKTAKDLGVNYGLLDYPMQTREVMRAILSGSGRVQEAQRMKKNLEEKGGERELLSGLMIAVSKDYSTLKIDYDRAVLDANRNYTYVNILSKPFVADKKAYPIRWLIVVFSTLAAVFLAILIIGVIERRKFGIVTASANEG
jgi:capsular polysaccharide biosynthesis protein